MLVQCPHCPNKVKVPANASRATCPQCWKTFDTSEAPTDAPATSGGHSQASAAASAAGAATTAAHTRPTKPAPVPRHDARDEDADEGGSASIWGALAFTLGVLAWFQG